MVLFSDGYTEISIIAEEDKQKVLELFAENNFGCDYETGSLRPRNDQFIRIMDNIISGKDDESNIFVLKQKGNILGYASCFVEYGRLTIGHIAVDKTKRNKGLGTLLTDFVILVAENEDRDVSLFCLHPNSCFKKMDFETSDGIHYFHKNQGRKTPEIPILFVSKEEYKKRQEKKMKEETDRFAKFLNSDIIKVLREL